MAKKVIIFFFKMDRATTVLGMLKMEDREMEDQTVRKSGGEKWRTG